jgi:hypothetical protein
MKNLNKLVLLIVLSLLAFKSQAAAVNDYRFMGSVAAVSEMCLKSEKISQGINKVVPAAVKQNPEIADVMNALVNAYNSAYKKAILDAQIWQASKDGTFAFSDPINCKNSEHLDRVRFLHDFIMKNLE